MSNLKKTIPLGISVLGAVSGYVLTNSIEFGICEANEVITEAGCINFFERLGDPLLYGMGALAVVFVLLLFVRKAWSAWKKFAIWFVPVAALVFIFYRGPGSGDLFSPYPEFVFKWASILYVAVSAGIIGLTVLRGKK